MDNRKELTPDELEKVNGAGVLDSLIIEGVKRLYEQLTEGW